MPEEWYAAPAFCFTNPYAMIGAHDDVPVPPGPLTVTPYEPLAPTTPKSLGTQGVEESGRCLVSVLLLALSAVFRHIA